MLSGAYSTITNSLYSELTSFSNSFLKPYTSVSQRPAPRTRLRRLPVNKRLRRQLCRSQQHLHLGHHHHKHQRLLALSMHRPRARQVPLRLAHSPHLHRRRSQERNRPQTPQLPRLPQPHPSRFRMRPPHRQLHILHHHGNHPHSPPLHPQDRLQPLLQIQRHREVSQRHLNTSRLPGHCLGQIHLYNGPDELLFLPARHCQRPSGPPDLRTRPESVRPQLARPARACRCQGQASLPLRRQVRPPIHLY